MEKEQHPDPFDAFQIVTGIRQTGIVIEHDPSDSRWESVPFLLFHLRACSGTGDAGQERAVRTNIPRTPGFRFPDGISDTNSFFFQNFNSESPFPPIGFRRPAEDSGHSGVDPVC